MRPDRPSATAYRVAMGRAAHQILDHPPVLEDAIALRIVGPAGQASIRTDRRHQSGFRRSLRAFLVARSRCAEDALAAAVAAGVRQYVVLGAGLDTFAYRNPHPPEALRLFEVDFPATQAWKRKLLERAGIVTPASLTFVPVDFETQTFAERLEATGFRADQPSCFSWLGVSMYLTRETVSTILAFVGRCPPVSSITFDYLIPLRSMSWFARGVTWLVMRRLAAAGEPWRTWFDPAELAAELRGHGFTRLEDLDGDALNARFFAGRRDGLACRNVGHVITAWR